MNQKMWLKLIFVYIKIKLPLFKSLSDESTKIQIQTFITTSCCTNYLMLVKKEQKEKGDNRNYAICTKSNLYILYTVIYNVP
jgi:hypothetical protein